MSNEALTAVAKAEIKPSGRKFVAMALADYADENWSCFPSVKQLAFYTSQGEKTVRDHLDALESDGFISRERRRREDGTLGRYRFQINQRRISPAADFARGEKRTSPAADFATHNPHIEPPISSLRSDNPRERTPVDELMEVLDPKRAQAVVDHRKQIRKALTAYAAKLLAAQLGRWHSPAEAADAMIANGWQGFKPEWLENKSNGRTSAPRMTALERARENFQQELADEQRQEGHQGDHHRSGDELPLLTEQHGR